MASVDSAGSNSPQALNENIKKGKFERLYFLYGDEQFLIDEALKNLQDAVLGDSIRDFNLNVFYGGDASAETIRDAIETLPMMAPQRLVVIKEAQELSEKEWTALEPVIDSPVDSTVVICVANKVDKRKKYIKRFQEKGSVIEYKRPYDNQVPDWIVNISKRHKLKLSQEVVEVIHQVVGSNLTDVNSELLKLSQFLGEKNTPTVEDILSVMSRARVDTVFDLTDAIGNNDRARALDCLVNLLDHGQNEVGVLALISRHMRILKTVREGQREGLQGAKLSSRAGVSPYFMKQYLEQAKNWSDSKIEQTFAALLDTDRALKSSPVSSHIWLENFIVRTCN